MKRTRILMVTLTAALLVAALAAGIKAAAFNEADGALAAVTITPAAEGVNAVAGRPDDTYFDRQWALPLLQGSTAGDGQVVIVAVLDSGIDTSHEDLSGRVIDSVNFSGSATADDSRGHGTHIAGILAANTNNNRGIAGASPGARLLNVKVAEDDGRVFPSRVAKGIIWAVDHGARIINMSLTMPAPSQSLQDAVSYALDHDVILIAAAGNNSGIPTYPSIYSGVIGVAALNPDGTVWSGSLNNDYTDIYLPGARIYSCMPGNKYEYKSGSSMAAAFASGLAANLLGEIEDANGDGRLSDELATALKHATSGLSK